MKIKGIITQGAKDVFVKKGFENTKILDISRHIKKGESSICSLFSPWIYFIGYQLNKHTQR
jgi:hypothetical protein